MPRRRSLVATVHAAPLSDIREHTCQTSIYRPPPPAPCNIDAGSDDAQSSISPAWQSHAGLSSSSAIEKTRRQQGARRGPTFAAKPDQVPAGFFAGAFCDFAGAGGGVGARSIETKRPPVKRYIPGQGPRRYVS